MSNADQNLHEHIFRVTVRGEFKNLSEKSRQYLVHTQPEHDIYISAFTTEGTFTYDDRILFFNMRYEVRVNGENAKKQAELHAQKEASAFLGTMKFGHVLRKIETVDVSEIWS